MMLLPYINEPATGSLIPSISTGGAAINAMMKQVAAARRQGTIRTPNQPTYKRLFVDVTHAQNSSQFLSGLLFLVEIVVIENECDVYLYDKTNPFRESPWSWFGVVRGGIHMLLILSPIVSAGGLIDGALTNPHIIS